MIAILINNHFYVIKMNIVSTLNEELLKQPFSEGIGESDILSKYQQIASGYALIENSIAVLSDLKANQSYIYNGGVAETLGIAEKGSTKNINSIWEEDIFERIHPGDLLKKHSLELQFYHLLKPMPVKERSDYYVRSEMRMKNNSEKYIVVQHRMFYISGCIIGNLWLSLCLYDFIGKKQEHEISDGAIINSATGEILRLDKNKCSNILSKREREILQLIEIGKASIEIADILYISKNTVSRHRQNILEKLRVKNSIEACRIAKIMNMI